MNLLLEDIGMKPEYFAQAALLIAIMASSSAAELGFSDQFETLRGQGSGADIEEAEKHALQNAISSRVSEMASDSKYERVPGFSEAVDSVCRNYRSYVGSYEVVSSKTGKTNRQGKDGQPEEIQGIEITVQAVVNTARIRRDFEKAIRMVELAKYGDNVAAVLEEWCGPEKDGKPASGRHAAYAIERLFMGNKFNQVSIQPLLKRFAGDLAAGKRLSSAEFKDGLLKELKGLAADIIIVGSIEAKFLRKTKVKAKGKDPVEGCLFEIKAWVEAYGRKKLDLLGKAGINEEATSELKDEVEAMNDLLGRAGEWMADAVCTEIVRKAEKAEEAVLGRPMLFVFENVEDSARESISSKIKGIEGVSDLKILRFGKGALILKAMVNVESEAFRKALLAAFKGEGLSMTSYADDKVIMKK